MNISTLTFAQNQSKKESDNEARDAFHKFIEISDKNHDGKISRDEFPAIKKDKVAGEAKFKKIDTNGDGFITEDEYIVFYKDMIKDKKKELGIK